MTMLTCEAMRAAKPNHTFHRLFGRTVISPTHSADDTTAPVDGKVKRVMLKWEPSNNNTIEART